MNTHVELGVLIDERAQRAQDKIPQLNELASFRGQTSGGDKKSHEVASQTWIGAYIPGCTIFDTVANNRAQHMYYKK